MPRGIPTDHNRVIDYINAYHDRHGVRPTNQVVADSLGLARHTVGAIITAYKGTDQIKGEPPAKGPAAIDVRLKTMQTIRQSMLRDGWAPSRREIASQVGCTPSKINGVIARLAADGLIEVGSDPRQIRIVNSVMKIPEVTL